MASYKSPISSLVRPQGEAGDPHETSLLTAAHRLSGAQPEDEPLNDRTPSFSLHKTKSLMLEEKSSMRLRPELIVTPPGASLDAPHFFMFPRPDQEVSAATPRMLPAGRTSTQRTSQIVRGSNESSGSFRGRRAYGQSSIDGVDGFLGSEHASGDFENATFLLKENLSPHLTPSLEAEVKARTQALEQENSRLRVQKLSLSQELNECEERVGQLEAERSRLEGDLVKLMAALAEQKSRAEEQQQRAQAAIREAQLKAGATERRARFLITYSRNLLSSIAESTLTASRRHTTASVAAGRSQPDDPRVSSQNLLNRSTDSCLQSESPHEEQPGENQTVYATPGSSFDEE